MKNLKTLLLFLSIFGSLFIFLNIHVSPKAKTLLECPHPILKISVYSTGNDFTLTNDSPDDGKWILSTGQNPISADTKVAQKLIKTLCSLTYLEVFNDQNSSQLKDFGFDSPRRVLEITLNKGNKEPNIEREQTVSLQIGGDSPTSTEFYMTTTDKPNQVFLMNNALLSTLMVHFPDLMERHIFDALKNDGTIFKNSIALSDDIKSILRAQVLTQYHGPLASEKLADFGMTLPDFSLDWVHKDQSKTHYDFSFFGDRYYVLFPIEDQNYVFILDAQAAKKLWEKIPN